MKITTVLLSLLCWSASAQLPDSNELTYMEFIGYVKKYHPAVRSANLVISAAQANLMVARGGFDPKISVDFEQKQFKDTPYYSLLNSSFKIPTWYGIEVKAGFDNNDGVYLNPQNNVPNPGLASLGIALPLGQGLLINQRMADLRKARVQLNLGQAERNLQYIEVIYAASVAYFNWKRSFGEVQLYEQYLENAQQRYSGIVKSIEAGDKPAIDSTEAGIVVRNRSLSLEESKLKLAKAKLEVSNFLWLENVPLELQDSIVPENNLAGTIKATLGLEALPFDETLLQSHPKINAIESKIMLFEIDRKLKSNLLLPKIDLSYSYLFDPGYPNMYGLRDHKVGVNFHFPLFIRKERGNVKLAKLKVQDTQFELEIERLQLKNKIAAQQTEVQSLERQRIIVEQLVKDNEKMLQSEERIFSFGESSIFLINARENNLVSSQLSRIALENRYLESNASLYRVRGVL